MLPQLIYLCNSFGISKLRALISFSRHRNTIGDVFSLSIPQVLSLLYFLLRSRLSERWLGHDFRLRTALEIDRQYWLVTCVFVVDVHQGDSEALHGAARDRSGRRLGTRPLFSAISTHCGALLRWRDSTRSSSYAMESARDSWAPLVMAVLGRSWSDLKSRGSMV
jgi:hypothetical protein